jgi:hypothetical protein
MRKQKKFEEFEEPINLIVHTKCPNKWMLIDRETGEIYTGNVKGYWDRLDPVLKNNT